MASIDVQLDHELRAQELGLRQSRGEDFPPTAATFDLAPVDLEEGVSKAAGLFLRIYRELEQRPVAPAMTRAVLRQRLAGKLLEDGVGLVRGLEDFESLVLPGSMGTPHPLYLGLVNSFPQKFGQYPLLLPIKQRQVVLEPRLSLTKGAAQAESSTPGVA
jgi:hypothetical protein